MQRIRFHSSISIRYPVLLKTIRIFRWFSFKTNRRCVSYSNRINLTKTFTLSKQTKFFIFAERDNIPQGKIVFCIFTISIYVTIPALKLVKFLKSVYGKPYSKKMSIWSLKTCASPQLFLVVLRSLGVVSYGR